MMIMCRRGMVLCYIRHINAGVNIRILMQICRFYQDVIAHTAIRQLFHVSMVLMTIDLQRQRVADFHFTRYGATDQGVTMVKFFPVKGVIWRDLIDGDSGVNMGINLKILLRFCRLRVIGIIGGVHLDP